MLISLNWLSDYVDITLPIAELELLFMDIGLNVEGVEDAGDDIVIDLEVTSNRPDCLGHIGVARELAAATGQPLKMPEVGATPRASVSASDLTTVTVDTPDLCPRYLAMVIQGVKIGPSPEWLVERLAAINMRSVNNVVDATNYVLMETSQPFHAFDFDTLAENRIVVRRATPGETITSIDGSECKLTDAMLVIADADKSVAVAGVMGGLATEVTDATTNILLEIGQFDPMSIRKTSRHLQLLSESNYRFERGIDALAMDYNAVRMAELIVQVAGGEIAEGMIDITATLPTPATVTLRPARTDSLLGMATPVDKQVSILADLGFDPKLADDVITCTIPTYRADITREADLIEEVGRHVGFDNIPLHEEVTHSLVPTGPDRRARNKLAAGMSAAGFDEAITFTFADMDEASIFSPGETLQVNPQVRRANNALRKSLINSLLRVAKTNQDAGQTDVHLYEVAAVFPLCEKLMPAEYRQVGMLSTGSLRHLRGAIETAIATACPLSALMIEPADVAGFEPGAAGNVMLDGELIGAFGQVASDVQDRYGLDRTIVAGYLNYEMFVARAGQQPTYQTLPKFPAITRDLSLIVDETVTWNQLESLVAGIDQPMRESINYVTTYRGKPVAKGKKSVTLSMTYRSAETTLRNEQVDEEVNAIITAATDKLDATLRT
jgi:phenylalanyl-tRNA synthetase beta chain